MRVVDGALCTYIMECTVFFEKSTLFAQDSTLLMAPNNPIQSVLVLCGIFSVCILVSPLSLHYYHPSLSLSLSSSTILRYDDRKLSLPRFSVPNIYQSSSTSSVPLSKRGSLTSSLRRDGLGKNLKNGGLNILLFDHNCIKQRRRYSSVMCKKLSL